MEASSRQLVRWQKKHNSRVYCVDDVAQPAGDDVLIAVAGDVGGSDAAVNTAEQQAHTTPTTNSLTQIFICQCVQPTLSCIPQLENRHVINYLDY